MTCLIPSSGPEDPLVEESDEIGLNLISQYFEWNGAKEGKLLVGNHDIGRMIHFGAISSAGERVSVQVCWGWFGRSVRLNKESIRRKGSEIFQPGREARLK